ncbi:MAG: Protein RarD [Desulfovibrio sp.]
MRAPSLLTAARKLDAGLWAALGSSLLWGTLPLYWYLLRDVSPYLILGHRIVWSCLFLFPLIVITRRMKEVVSAGKDAKTLRGLFCSSIVLAGNWGLFIWAVNNGRVLETSLGYYICPLITICFGIIIFRDRPTRTQGIAIILAFIGVTAEVLINGVLPVAGLAMGSLFSVYAVLRKLAPVESLPGLALETLILCPFALAFIIWTGCNTPVAAWGKDTSQVLLLMGTGVATSVPLILYAYGARHLPFTTLGILQYISPTCSFLLGIFVFHEAFTVGRAVSFVAVWTALAIYTVGSFRARKKAAEFAAMNTSNE